MSYSKKKIRRRNRIFVDDLYDELYDDFYHQLDDIGSELFSSHRSFLDKFLERQMQDALKFVEDFRYIKQREHFSAHGLLLKYTSELLSKEFSRYLDDEFFGEQSSNNIRAIFAQGSNNKNNSKNISLAMKSFYWGVLMYEGGDKFLGCDFIVKALCGLGRGAVEYQSKLIKAQKSERISKSKKIHNAHRSKEIKNILIKLLMAGKYKGKWCSYSSLQEAVTAEFMKKICDKFDLKETEFQWDAVGETIKSWRENDASIRMAFDYAVKKDKNSLL